LSQGRVTRAKAFKEWLANKSALLELFYLRGYSPERNPDELLNQELKATFLCIRATYQEERPETQAESQAILNTSQSIPLGEKQPSKISAYFQKHSVRYAAE
jgi:hypothetical protein